MIVRAIDEILSNLCYRMSKQVGIRFEDSDFDDLKKLADADGRKVANFLRRKILKSLPDWKTELAQAASPSKYAVPGRSALKRGQRGVSKKSEN